MKGSFVVMLLLSVIILNKSCLAQESHNCEESYTVSSIQFICLDCSGLKISLKSFSCEKGDSIISTSSIGMDATPEIYFATNIDRTTLVQIVEPFNAFIEIPFGFDYNYVWINHKKIINQEASNDARINLH